MNDGAPGTASRLRAWAYRYGPATYYRPAYRQIAQEIGIPEGAILDVGCGPGWLSIFLAAGKPNLDAVGIDSCATMLGYAESNKGPSLNVTFRQMDAAEIIYPADTFHVACAVQSAHHWERPESVLSEVYRVLRPGGRFYIYEADSSLDVVPDGWIGRKGPWPPDRWVRWNWGRYGMDDAAWEKLKESVQSSPFGGGEDGRHGFYRRMVLTRSS